MRFDRKNKCATAPYSVNISVTEKCSLKCPMCFQPFGKSHQLPIEQLYNFIDDMVLLGTRHVQFSGGEPLLYPKLSSAIAYAKSKGMVTRIATSGVGLDNEMIENLEKSGLDYCHISLNGSKADIHNLTRSHFHETVDSIKQLAHTSIPTVINWVANHKNIDDLKYLMDFAKEQNVLYISVLANKSSNQKYVLHPLDDEDLNKLSVLCQTHGKYLIVENCFYQLHHKMNTSQKKHVDSGCRAGRFYMAIDAKGRFSPCPHLDTFRSEATSIETFWKTDSALKEIRNQLETEPSEKCADCLYLKICRPCLIHQATHRCMEVIQ